MKAFLMLYVLVALQSALTRSHSLRTNPFKSYTKSLVTPFRTVHPRRHLPRVPPGLPPLPGPFPENIGVSVVDGIMVHVSRRIIQQLLFRSWTLIFEKCHRDPNGILPEGGLRQSTEGLSFSLVPREGVHMTWSVVCEAFQLIEALQSAGGYGLARMDVHNGNRVIGVAYVDESPGRS